MLKTLKLFHTYCPLLRMHCIGHLIVRWQWIILNNAFYVHCIAWSSHDLKGLTMNDSCVFIENDGSRRKFSKTHSNAKYSTLHIGATKFEFYNACVWSKMIPCLKVWRKLVISKSRKGYWFFYHLWKMTKNCLCKIFFGM